MKIIQATENHLNKVTELFDAYRVWYRKESNIEMSKSFLLERIQKKESIIYVAEDVNGLLLGFTQLYPFFSSTRMKRAWLLNDLYVRPENRGQGISKMLIEKSKELARNSDACGILLETEKSNDIGNQLYPKTGFELESNNFYFWINQ